MTKRIGAIVLSILLCFTMIPTQSFAVATGTPPVAGEKLNLTIIDKSGEVPPNTADKAIDGIKEDLDENFWKSGTLAGWIVFGTEGYSIPDKYAITSNSDYYCKDLYIQTLKDESAYKGAGDKHAFLADDNNWQTIADERYNTKEVFEDKITTDRPASIYRLNITKTQWGKQNTQILEFELFGKKVEPANVTYSGNGGKGSLASELLVKGTEYTLPANPYKYNTKAFTGWKVGGTIKQPGDVIILNSDNNIVAQWKTNSIPYVDEHGAHNSKSAVNEILPSTTEITTGWWFFSKDANRDIDGQWQNDKRINVKGDAKVIISDGCDVQFKGFHVTSGNKITLYGQSENSGELRCFSKQWGGAAIGSDPNEICGEIVINGGRIIAYGGRSNSAGIGNSSGSPDGGTITINGGYVDAQGGSNDSGYQAAGIGSGSYEGGSVDIFINGGTVDASGNGGGAAIGAGDYGRCGNITITGGNVNAKATFQYYQGDYLRSAAIGGCANKKYNEKGANPKITITGGTVNAEATGPEMSAIRGDFYTPAGSNAVIIAKGADAVEGYHKAGPAIADSNKTKGDYQGIISTDGGKNLKVYGNVTVDEELYVPKDAKLTVPSGSSLTVAPGAIVQNAGTIEATGTITNNGEIRGNAVTGDVGGDPVVAADEIAIVNKQGHNDNVVAAPFKEGQTTIKSGWWYIPEGTTITATDQIIAENGAKLILLKGSALNVQKGIKIASGSRFEAYQGQTGTGVITAGAAIGNSGSTFALYGPTVDAKGGIGGKLVTTGSTNALATLTAKSIADTSNKGLWKGIISYDGGETHKIYGNRAEAAADLTIKNLIIKKDQELTVSEGATLTLAEGGTLDNQEYKGLAINGNFLCKGTLKGGSIGKGGSGYLKKYEDTLTSGNIVISPKCTGNPRATGEKLAGPEDFKLKVNKCSQDFEVINWTPSLKLDGTPVTEVKQPGTYTVEFKRNDGGGTPVSQDFAILKPDADASLENITVKYGETFTPNGTATHTELDTVWTYEYAGREGTAYPRSDVKPELPGKYTIYANCESTNYEGFITAQLEIQKADITGSIVQNGKLTYNGGAQTAAVTNTLASVKNQLITVKYGILEGSCGDLVVPKFAVAGDHTVYYEATAANHNVKKGNFTVHIEKAEPVFEKPVAKKLVYSSAAQELLEAGTVTGGTVYYKLGTGDWATELPKAEAAGTYNVYYKVTGDANHKNILENTEPLVVKIAEKPITINIKNQTIGFGGIISTAIDQVTLDSGALAGTDALDSIVLQTTATDATENGEITASGAVIKKAGTDVTKNYKISYGKPGKLVINKADSALTKAPEAKELSYTGKAQELVLAGTAENGEVQYSLSADKDFSTTIPKGKDAKTYKVYYKVAGDKNHNDTAVQSVDVTVKSVPLTITAENKTVKYGAAAPEYTVKYDGFVNSETKGVLSGKLKIDCDYTNNSEAGTTHVIKPSGLTSTNYSISFVNGNLSVGKANAVVTAPKTKTLIFNNTNQALVTAGEAPAGAEMQYSLTKEGGYSTAIPTGKDAKEYTVWYKVAGGKNYADQTAKSVTVTIKQKDIANATITLGDSLTYTGNPLTQNVTKVEIDGLAVTYDVSNNVKTKAGDYELTVTGKGNFTGTATKEFNIAKADATVTAPVAKDLTFNGETQDLVTAGKAPEGALIQFQLEETGEFQAAVPKARDAKEYIVYYFVFGGENYKNQAPKPITVTIKQKDIAGAEINLDNTLTYTGNELTQKIKPVVIDGLTATYDISDNVKTDAGDYELTVTGKENFKGTATKAFKVAKAPLTVTAENKTVKYGAAAPEYTVKYDGFVNKEDQKVLGGKLKFDCDYTNTSEAGTTHHITPSGLTSTNYNISFVNGNLTVNKAAAEVKAPTANKLTYNGEAQALVTAGTVPAGAEMQYSLSETDGFTTDIPTGKDQGEYTVWYKVAGGKNYVDQDAKSVTVNIAKKNIKDAVITLDNSLTYTGNEITQNVKDVVVDSLSATYDVTENTATNAGKYTLTVSGNGNFTGTATKEFTIAKAEPLASMFTAGNLEVTYDGKTHKPEVNVNEDILGMGEVTVTTEAAKVSDSAEQITFSVAEGDNYLAGDLTLDTAFTVNAKPLTIKAAVADKAWDGKKDAEIVSAELEGVVEGDEVKPAGGKAEFTSETEGKDIPVIISEYTLEGKDAGNYTVSMPEDVKAEITHNFGEPEFTFSEDGKEATAKRICKGNKEHVETAEAVVTSEVKKPATLEAMGVTLYTATVKFGEEEFTATKEVTDIPKVKPASTVEKIVQQKLDKVPEGLLNTKFNTIAKIENALKKSAERVALNELGVTTSDDIKTIIFDAVLMITENGVSRPATKEEIEARGGITVVIPYPEGTNKDDYYFVVSHMLTVAMNGMEAGDIETPEITFTEDGLKVTLKGLSPVMVAYAEKPEEKSAKTGDDNNMIPWMMGLAVALTGTGFVVVRKKENE